MTGEQRDVQKPPFAPEIQRKFRLYRFQYIGGAVIILIPVLALLGVFGETITRVQEASPELQVEVEYVTRYRYKMLDTLTVSVENLTGETVPALTIRFSRTYVEQFSTVAFSPPEARITGEAYIVELQSIEPGAIRVVQVALQAEKYGIHEGVVSASAEGIAPVSVPIRTIVFP